MDLDLFVVKGLEDFGEPQGKMKKMDPNGLHEGYSKDEV